MPYQLDSPIVAHSQLDEFEYEISLRAPQVAAEARPGQFVQLLCGQTYVPFTRRPFSVYRVDTREGTFSIVYLARGSFTRILATRQVGESISVVGPLGNAFQPDPTPGAMHVLVAGGVGAPPLFFLAERILHAQPGARVAVINGARTRSLVVGEREFSQLPAEMHFTTEDGSLGTRGLVTDVLEGLLRSNAAGVRVYACGPTAMLRAVASRCLATHTPCQVSVETVMPCGVGVCMGCVVKIRDAEAPGGFVYKRSCADGPVFEASEVIWE